MFEHYASLYAITEHVYLYSHQTILTVQYFIYLFSPFNYECWYNIINITFVFHLTAIMELKMVYMGFQFGH